MKWITMAKISKLFHQTNYETVSYQVYYCKGIHAAGIYNLKINLEQNREKTVMDMMIQLKLLSHCKSFEIRPKKRGLLLSPTHLNSFCLCLPKSTMFREAGTVVPQAMNGYRNKCDQLLTLSKHYRL